RELVLEVERMRTLYGIKRSDRSPSRLDSFVKSLEEERDYFKKEMEKLERTLSFKSSLLNHSGQGHTSPDKDGKYSSELRRITKERDDLQSMLERFENHMAEIQSNVKVLTMEKDKINLLYDQAQNELMVLKKEISPPFKMPSYENELHDVEKERDFAVSDLRRVTDENEGLRDKIKIQQEDWATDKSKFHQKISDLENTIHTLEAERFELKSTISHLEENIALLEKEGRLNSASLAQTLDDSSHYKAELSSLRLLNEQLQKSISDLQHRLTVKCNEVQLSQQETAALQDNQDDLKQKINAQTEEVNMLRHTIAVLDKEKDNLQETVDDKTERIACLDDNLANKEKTITDLRLTVSELESRLDQIKDSGYNKDLEVASLRRQLDSALTELTENARLRDISLKENRRLQDDLGTMARENQAVTMELQTVMHEKEELKLRVHGYISEVSRIESLMAAKEQENRDLLDQFRMVHSQAEEWEMKVQHAEGESSSVRLELLSVDTDRRHLRERLEHTENEIQEHLNAHQAYEAKILTLTKTVSKLEEHIRHVQNEKTSILADLSAVRELCVKLDSNKEQFSRQLTIRNMEHERVLGELEDMKSEGELLKKQLSSERLTIKNLETLLATNREKEFQSHLTSHEKDSEIQLLKDRLILSESKLTSISRETTMLRNKLTQLQADCDIAKRQLTTERFERERAVQELRRHGLSTSSARSSSPLTSTALSPERSILRSVDRGADKSAEKNVSFKD
ncbi:hypothetical protein GDO86_000415, partial [Hymenochirus boettgeri]